MNAISMGTLLIFFVEIKDFMQELWSLDMVFSSMARVCDPIRNFDKKKS